jgi:hypothetical protein
MKMGSRLLAGALVAVSAMAMGMGEARANIVGSAVFTSDHCSGAGGCLSGQANAGTLTITDHQNGTLDFNVQLANGNVFLGSGLDASFAFNLVGNPTITYSGITPVGWTILGGSAPQQSAGSYHDNGTGFFEYGLDVTKNGFSHNTGSSLAFSITAAGLDISDFEANAAGQFFVADIYSGTTGNSGAVDISISPTTRCVGDGCNPPPPPPSVPEPGSLQLLGGGLGGVGAILSWRRRRDRSETSPRVTA